MRAKRCEVDLDAAARAERGDHHRAAEEAPNEICLTVAPTGNATQGDFERLAETDDERHEEGSRFDLTEMPARVFLVANKIDDRPAQCRMR